MKSAKAFILWLLALYVCLFAFDWMKTSVFPLEHHAIVVWAKTFFLVMFGTLIMALTLSTSSFKSFASVYLGIWLIYFALKVAAKAGIQLFSGKIEFSNIFLFYVNFTQILTPLPFIVFWIFNRVYLSKMYAIGK